MTLIPAETQYSFKRADRGTGVWAVQRALNRVNFTLDEDGIYGTRTLNAVRDFQLDHGLIGDGVFGPASSAAMARRLEDGFGGVAPGLLRGIVEGESGNLIAAVNWSVPGGVDCGYIQRRVYSPDFENVQVVHAAFDSLGQITLLADEMKKAHDAFLGEPGVEDDETAWRLAGLSHNWPSGAQTIAQEGIDNLADFWREDTDWVIKIGAKYPDETAVTTSLGWAKFYALGSKRHNWPGLVTKYL